MPPRTTSPDQHPDCPGTGPPLLHLRDATVVKNRTRFRARRGKTIILVTHHLEEIFPEINRVVLLQHGRASLDGAKNEVLTSPNLSARFEGPVTGKETHGYYTARSKLCRHGFDTFALNRQQ
jgi:ABC-type sulfate/molybdate transport systems ATPase subunit